MKMYIYVHMPSGVFLCFFAEASPSVQFVTASLGNVVMGKKIQKYVTISPEDARSKTNCHCVVRNMDSV